MIYPNPAYLVFLVWLLVGPPSVIRFIPLLIVVPGLMIAVALRRSFGRKTWVLLSVLGVMCFQSLMLALNALHFRLCLCAEEARHFSLVPSQMSSVFHYLFNLDLRLAELGVVAAACVGFYVYFGKSRLDLSKAIAGSEVISPPAQLQMIVSKVACVAGISPPDLCVIDSGIPSAFTLRAKGKHVMALTVGLLESFEPDEVEACIAHEIAHLKNRDFMIRSLATLAKIALFAKPLSYLIEPAIYRAREFQADKTASLLLGGPSSLISVLTKLMYVNPPNVPTVLGSVCSCYLNLRTGRFRFLDKHPDLATRIKVLERFKR